MPGSSVAEPESGRKSGRSGLRHLAVVALAVVGASVLAWRVVVAGLDALSQGESVTVTAESLELPGADEPWRERLEENPTDASAMVFLARVLERQGKPDQAAAAFRQAMRLAPNDVQVLQQAAGFYLRTGDQAAALAALARSVQVPDADINASIWDVFVGAFNSGSHSAFFNDGARRSPPWWTVFFQRACANATNLRALYDLYTLRREAGRATADETRCVIDRFERENQWTWARQIWLNSLPAAQQKRVAFVFNGDFEAPLSNSGFGWIATPSEGVNVYVDRTDGMTGERALNVSYANTRYGGPPIYQYLMLDPGRYAFSGRGRANLGSWLGLQWSIYCRDPAGTASRQLAASEAFVGTIDWKSFQQDFKVPPDCSVQILRLELANPVQGTKAPGNVVIRLNGRLAFDDLRVRALD